MGTAKLEPGTDVVIDGKQAKLLRKIDEVTWQLEDAHTKRITERTTRELHELLCSGFLKFKVNQGSSQAGLSAVSYSASEADWEVAKIRRMYVLETLPFLYSKREISAAANRLWKTLEKPSRPPSLVTLYRWRKAYLNAGQDIKALLPQDIKKGNKESRYPADVELIVKKAINKVYLTLERKSIEDTLAEATTLVTQENRIRPSSLLLPTPTRRLVKRMIEAIPAFDRYTARYGRTAAKKRFRSVLAHRTTEAPLERAEIDHTPLDLMVIDDDTSLPLGRPYLTVCLDDYTRNVLGIYISFEPPSHFTVSRCLKMAFLPKVALLAQYPAIQNPWEAHGVMRELVVDNGQEFHSTSLENACLSLGIEIHYSARKTPWFKGKIERFLGTLNRAIAHGTPGTTFSNIFEKEDYDPSAQAIVRFSTLKEMAYTWIADVYHQKVHRTLGAPPAVVWARSISPEDILLPENPDELDFILGRNETRVLSHKGIELNNLLYNSPELTALRYKLGDKMDVGIRYDTSDLGYIFVLPPGNRQAIKVQSLQFAYANGLSLWQHKVCRRFALREMKSYSSEGWLEAKSRIQKLIEEEFMDKRQKTRTKIARFKNMDAAAIEAPAEDSETQQPALIPESPAPQSSSLEPAEPPVAEPPTELQTARQPRRIKPVYRERLSNFLAEENADDEGGHD